MNEIAIPLYGLMMQRLESRFDREGVDGCRFIVDPLVSHNYVFYAFNLAKQNSAVLTLIAIKSIF